MVKIVLKSVRRIILMMMRLRFERVAHSKVTILNLRPARLKLHNQPV